MTAVVTPTGQNACIGIGVMPVTGMMPWMVLVLVSRKVKGMPVGVEPTFSACCAEAGRLAARARTATAA